MNKETKEKYVSGLTFGIKDFSLTKEKYGDYKQDEYLVMLDNHTQDIKEHLGKLKSSILYWFKTHPTFYLSNSDFDKKMDIRHLKTSINGITRSLNSSFVKSLLVNANKITIDRFSIKLYLDNYKQINDTMQQALKDKVVYGL